MKTIEQLKIFFQQKMSHIISLKVTKFQQPLLITLGVADEKPEGAKSPTPPPPRNIGLKFQQQKFRYFDLKKVCCTQSHKFVLGELSAFLCSKDISYLLVCVQFRNIGF